MRLLAVVAVLCALVVGCSDPGPEALLEQAPAALTDAGTARFTMSVTTTGAVRDEFAADGEQDLRTGSLRMTVTPGEDQGDAETLLVDNQLYVRSALTRLFGLDDATWVRFDLEAAAAEAGVDTDELVSANSGPVALLQQLGGAAEDIQRLGREEVRGIATTRLQLTIVTERAIAQAPDELREQLRAYADATALPDRYPMEVWLDDDGLPRRLRTVLDVREKGRSSTQQLVLELYDYGDPVDLDPPSDAEVVDLRELTEQLDELERGLGSRGGTAGTEGP